MCRYCLEKIEILSKARINAWQRETSVLLKIVTPNAREREKRILRKLNIARIATKCSHSTLRVFFFQCDDELHDSCFDLFICVSLNKREKGKVCFRSLSSNVVCRLRCLMKLIRLQGIQSTYTCIQGFVTLPSMRSFGSSSVSTSRNTYIWKTNIEPIVRLNETEKEWCYIEKCHYASNRCIKIRDYEEIEERERRRRRRKKRKLLLCIAFMSLILFCLH